MADFFIVFSFAYLILTIVLTVIFGSSPSTEISGGEVLFYMGAIYFITFLLLSMLTGRHTKKGVDYSTCEFAKTSKHLYAECENGVMANTKSRYVYENYKDSTKVGVYKLVPTSATGLTVIKPETDIKAK